MDYRDYIQLMEQVSQLSAENKLKEAEDALYSLLVSDISELDKAEVCVKMAGIHDRTGNSDEVLALYDKGIQYEQPFCRYEAALAKARYLAQLGHSAEAVPIYEDLLKQSYVREVEKETFRQEIRKLLSRAIGEWK